MSAKFYRYTAFPSLHPITFTSTASTTISAPLNLPITCTNDAIVLSWAYLLRGHGATDPAVFRVDGDTSGVEFDSGKLVWIAGGDIDMSNDGRWTGVYFTGPPSETEPQLYLIVDMAALTAHIHASSALVPQSYPRALASQFFHILTSVPPSPFSPIPPFPDSPLSILNPTPIRLPGPSLLHQLIRFSGHGNKLALDFLHADGMRNTYSYAELDILSTKFAIKLTPYLHHSRKVPMLLRQSPDLYIALLGILKAGAAFVPLSLDAPVERIRFVVTDVDAACIVTQTELSHLFSWIDCPPTVTLEDEVCSFSLEGLLSLPGWIEDRNTAYVMYTSGSTGTPKGVSVSHRAATQSLLAHERHIPGFTRWLQFAAPTFDVFVFEMFFPLVRGVVLVGCERRRLLEDLPAVVREMRVDGMELTPTVVTGLLGRPEDVPGLKVLLTIGEMLTAGVVEMWGDGILQGMYGPTEAAIHCTLAAGFERRAKAGDLGVPFDSVSAFVIAPYKGGEIEVLPAGWVGELVVGGWQLADGYLNRPEQTREVFIESAVYGRLYRTGDRARILPAGRIECLGRIGVGQVKLRGQRVELGEIEEVVLKTPGAKGCVANVLDSTMVVWVGGSVDQRAVLDICKKWLPSFMVPGDIVVLDELPRLSSGKADRKRLESEYRVRVNDVEEGMELGERVIADEVERLLGVSPGRYASLIALGLDSIQAIRLVSALRKKGSNVEVINVLRADTVAGIAGIIDHVDTTPQEVVLKQFEAVEAEGRARLSGCTDIEKIIPCTSIQSAMLAETARDRIAYCNWILLSLPSHSVAAVEKALRTIIDANEILRTGFVVLDHGYAQIVYHSSRPTQFGLCESVGTGWSTTMDELIEPPFRATLVGGELSVQIHHALYDGWCWEQVMMDFAKLLEGRTVSPRPQYMSIVKRELARSTKAIEESAEYWKNVLDGFVPSKLPSLNGRSNVAATVGRVSSVLSVGRKDYSSAARALGVSPQIIVQAAWAFLWSFYIGSTDVVFGSVVSGRTVAMEGVEDVLGPTILTLPVRVGVGRERVVRDVVADLAKCGREMLMHEFGLREVRKVCEIEGTLFESLLVWQQTLQTRGESCVKILDARDRLEFMVLIEIEPGVEEISLRATYQSATLPQAQIKLMLSQLDQLISGIMSQPDQTLAKLQGVLTEDVLAIENPNPSMPSMADVPTLADLVERTVTRTPNAIAVEFANDIVDGVMDSTKLTYSEINAQANKLACHLLSLGAGPDELVCVCMGKSPVLYVSLLAVLKAGAAYIPITPETPKERISYILTSADVRLFLTTSDLEKTLEVPEGVNTVVVDRVNVKWYSKEDPEVERSEGTLAYAVFTSGSTGLPKGVLIENKAIVSHLLVLSRIYPTRPGSRMFQFCTYAFDVSIFEIFFTWSMGMTLCSGPKDLLLRDIEGAINVLGATHLSMTSTVAALVNPDNVPCVEFLVTAGEEITPKVFGNWAGRGLYAGYGPSENVNICTVRPRVRREDNINTVGEPLANTLAFVSNQDEELNLVPRGGVGELCIGGVQVARGYLKMPELTDRKFITHPKYGRVYRTGDICRILSDNSIDFVRRMDDQVKIRGHRIELGEINSILLRSDAVLDVATMPIQRQKMDAHQLVAFVLLDGHRDQHFAVVQADEEVRKTLVGLFTGSRGFLPSYMVPAVIVPVTIIPMTVTGKTDKRLLERMYLDMDSTVLELYNETFLEQGGDNRDWTAVEREIIDIIADFTRVTACEVTRNTSIFKLGLDSISAIQLSNRIMDAGYTKLDVSQIMQNPSVGALVALLENTQPTTVEDSTTRDVLREFGKQVQVSALEQLGVSADDIVKILPCTPLQEAMLTQKKEVDARTYYNHTVLNLRADPSRLREAWAIMVKSHDIMRTCFCVTSDSRHAYAQVVLKTHELPWATFKLEATQELIDERISEISSSMNMTRTPYAFSLFLSPKRATLIMSFHHSLYDGFAMNLLLHDVRRAYHGLGLPTRRPFDPFLEYMENVDLAAADKFWASILAGLEPSSFPDLTGKTTLFKQETKLTGMASARITCSRSLRTVEEGCKNLSTSLLALGQTGWARLLSVYSGETDLCFGSVVSGRTIAVEGVEDIIAPCFNTVPLRVQLTPGATNQSTMDIIQRLNADILPYQLTPLRRIMNTIRTEGRGLFDTLFILQHAHQSSFTDLWEEAEDRGEMDFSVVVEFVPSRNKNTLDIVLHFRRDLILEEDASVLLEQLNETIISSLEHPLELAVDFNAFDSTLLSAANVQPLSLEGGGYDLLHSDFERHARENSSRNALEFLDIDGKVTMWTFGELNKAANQVAHYLISMDLKRDNAIPLCLEKSPIFYICVLGVLKAGCAFTPIDPTLPLQRKLFMLHELEAKVVLVTTNTSKDLSLPAGVKIVDIESTGLLVSQPTINPYIQDLSSRCLAYRLYTSGSTGQPKAVSLEIKSAVQTFRASKTLIPWNTDSRLLQFAATTFDMCYYDCFMAWSYGFTICSAAKKLLLGDLEETIRVLNATLLDLTPTVASTLVAENLPAVEMLYCIGEPMPQKLVDNWDGRCLNSYGPTEAAMCCTIIATNKEVKSSNIGRPFTTTSFSILSRDGKYIVPTFGCGELCIGGPQVAREYHNNSQLTNSRFIRLGKDTVYRTGDIVRMMGDRTFEFIGRVDDQVKIRGLRVELDEINSILRDSHSGIKDAATIVSRYSGGAKEQLVSFIATESRKQDGTPAIVLEISSQTEEIQSVSREAVQKKLPRYMIPAVILLINYIPLSAAGKVDKRALAILFKEQDIQSFGASNKDEDERTWTEDERKIRDVLSQISRVPVEQISRTSTIYEIGLDSISASQVAMQLGRAGIQISVLDILERPSINQLSILLTEDSKNTKSNVQAPDDFMSEFSDRFLGPISSEVGIAKERISGVFPCTPAQEGMLSQFHRSKGTLYFNHIVFKLPQDVDLIRLRESWNVVLNSHEMLRAGFVGVDDARHSFATIILRQGSVNLPWFTMDSLGDSDKLVSAQKQLNTSRALEGLHSPPWSVTVFKKLHEGFLLLFSAHHALYDAQSLSLVLDDVFAEYSGNHISPRPQFSTVLNSIVRHMLDAKVLEEDKLFWTKQLQGTSISRFPNLCPVRVKGTSSHVCSIETDWSLSKIENGCRKLGISINAAGQAAWARVLSAYTGDNAVTMGIVLSGRSGVADAENVSFPCITTVPSICLLTGTNLELALALQQSNAQMLKYQHTPLRAIQGWLGHAQESRFDSIFVYQKTGSSRENSSSLWEVIEEDSFVDYAISLEIEPTGVDSLLIHVTCRENVVPKEQSHLILRQFEAALMDILLNPNNSSTGFSGFPPTLLSCTPAKVDEIPTNIHLLHKFVERYRQLTPNKPAFEFATSIQEDCTIKKTWTYTQLDEEGNRIANYLLHLGAKTGEIIGICFEKCPEASFAILGILKAGCAFLALDYNAPTDRKAFIIEDSGAKYVLTMEKFAIEFTGKLKVGVIVLEGDMRVKESPSETPVIGALMPEDLCYCLYTSGTTGTPKGCVLTHGNAVQAMLAFQRLFSGHWDAESHFLQFASFHFDVSVLEQYWSWSVGICVTSAPRDVILQDLALTINELQITHLDLTPSLAVLLRPEDVPSLCRGVFITGGEQLKQEIIDNWGPKGVIYNGYGPTEVTIGCTMYPRVPVNGKPSNIGPQFDNVGTLVLTSGTDRPVFRGAIGELCISGKLVGRGYLNRPSLTEERFSYLKELDTRIYRTGDLVRILYDGTFDFAGRADDQVKLRGQRLEIGEINETLKKADPRVKAVATLVLKHPKQQKDQLVSFIVTGTNNTSNVLAPVFLDDPEQVIPILAGDCRRNLPVYMVPTHFLHISRMPLSVNNKVDNKKLTAIYHDTSLALLQQISRREEAHEKNWTDAENRIRKILTDITSLQPSEVKRSSTVFELGLDSVSVVGLARRLRKDGFFASSVSLVMQNPGIKQLAAELSKGESNNSEELARMESINQKLAAFANKATFEVCEQLEIEPDQIEAVVPCTALQEGMILRFIDSEKPLYYNSFSLLLSKSTDACSLHAAWNTVVKSTSILRTCFCETSDGYAQVVLRDSEVQWQEIYLGSDGEVQRVISNEMMKHADMNRDLHQTPLYLLLLRTPSRIIVVVNIFHALYDGYSLPLIFNDVQSAYRDQFQPRSHQFFEVVGHVLSVDMDNARNFWKASLAEAKPSTFPQLSNSMADSDHLTKLQPKIDIADVENYCRQLNCTPQAVFQVSWASVLSPYLGPHFAFGVVISGRLLPMDSIEDTIGPLFNTIPCTFDVKSAHSWEKLVQQAHRFNSESIPYHHTPLRLINKLMRVSPEKPFFDTLFVYQKDFSDREVAGTAIWKLVDSSTIADYPLALEIEESFRDGLTFSIVAKNSVLTNHQSLELLRSLEKQIHKILQNPHGKPSLGTPDPKPFVPTELTNGVYTNGRKSEFQWGFETKALRSTIAMLADVGESEIGEDSSIFELGLDSIEAIKLSSRLLSSGIKLPVSTIMRNPTIRKLQGILTQSPKNNKNLSKGNQLAEFEQKIRQGLNERKHRLSLDQIEAIYPTTPLQEGMIAETLASDCGLYFNHDTMELASEVDLRRLKDAWESVFQKSEILRASFFHVSEIVTGLPYTFGQVVHKRPQLRWKEVSLSSKENMLSTIKGVIQQASKDVNMFEEPPLRITIIRTPKTRYLVLSISHVLYDGWSLGLLDEDVQSAYFGSLPSRPSCRILLENIFSTDIKKSEKFWKQMLAGASPSIFHIQVVDESSLATTHRFERQSALPFRKIQTFCKQAGVTVQSLGQVCWALLLAHYLGHSDVLFGTVLSGRDFESAEEIAFPAMNTVPVRAIIHGDYSDMLHYMQDNTARALRYQHTPLRKIQTLIESQGQRLFDTLFIYQRGRELCMGDKKPLWNSIEGVSDVEYNVCIEMEHIGKKLVWRSACKSTALTATDSETLLQTLDSLLVHIINNTNHPAVTYRNEATTFGNIQTQIRRPASITNLNGLRIDLDEMAMTIQKGQNNIEDSAAIVAKENERDSLIIFITGHGNDGKSILEDQTLVRALATFARQKFPHWSMPSFIIPMSTIPYKDNKINRAELESYFFSIQTDERNRLAVQEQNSEWSPLELTFRSILSRVSTLPEAEIERTQTIFHLGLDSISAIGFSSELRKQSIFLSVAEILRAATIERMATTAKTMNSQIFKAPVDTEKALQKTLGDINILPLLGNIPEDSIENVAPGTSGQVYMLSTWKNSNYMLFMPTFTFRCRKIEQSRILSAWKSLVRQETILRTTFLTTEDEAMPLVQVIFRNPPVQYEWYQSSATNNSALTNFLASQEQQKHISLEYPPVRLTILTTPVDTIVFLTIHHALYDGVSLPLLLAKFQDFIESDTERLPIPNPDNPRFLDFVTFTHSQDIQQQSRFWRKYLDGAISTLVPLKHPDVQSSVRTEVFRPGVLGERSVLENRSRAEGVSLQSIFLAAYAKVYAYHLGLNDGPVKQRENVVFGIYLSNRHLPVADLSSMAAPTLNIVPLRIRSPRKTLLIQLARQIQADLVEIGNSANGVVGLWQVEKWTGIQVDCFFNFLKLPGDFGNSNGKSSGRKDRINFEEVKVDVKPGVEIGRTGVMPGKPWMESAKTNLDIEVAVRGDRVDVGVFSPAQNFSNEDALSTIEWMCDIVMGIL